MEIKRDLSLDYAKGIAILSIVIGHLYYYSGSYTSSWVFDVCDTIQLPIFMYISGLLAHRSIDRYGFRKLVSHRAVRLLLPLLSIYVIRGLIDYRDFIEIPVQEFKRGYWFMIVLYELMVTLSFIKQASTKLRIPTYIVNGAVFAFVTAYELLMPKDSFFNQLTCINLYWHYYPFFMLGYYHYKLDGIIQMKYVPAFLLVYLPSLYFYHTNGIRPLILVCNISSLLLLMTVFQKGSRPLEPLVTKLGENSLQIYLIHFFILLPLCHYLPFTENLWLEFLCNFVIAIIIIAITIAIAQLLMKNDLLNLLLFGNRKEKTCNNEL